MQMRETKYRNLFSVYIDVREYNVVIVNWRNLASDAELALSNIGNIGDYIGKFIAFVINTTGGSALDYHLVGRRTWFCSARCRLCNQ